jgi:hypothetical protein
VTVSTPLRAAIDDVYAFLLDNRNDPRWCPLASEVELVEGEPGLGALYRFRQGQGPGQPERGSWLRTTEAVPPTRLVWDNDGRGISYTATIDLEPRGDRTHLRHTNRVSLANPVQQALWWTSAQGVLRLQLRNLRRELER